jgi:hypothetical protein
MLEWHQVQVESVHGLAGGGLQGRSGIGGSPWSSIQLVAANTRHCQVQGIAGVHLWEVYNRNGLCEQIAVVSQPLSLNCSTLMRVDGDYGGKTHIIFGLSGGQLPHPARRGTSKR